MLNRFLLENVARTEAPDGEPERAPFSRQRYDVHLDADTMLTLGLTDLKDIETLVNKQFEKRVLSSTGTASRIGRQAANQIQDDDFLRTFDVRRPVDLAPDSSQQP
jgi:hypothetical protein